jgi:hypothetical protein
MRHPPQEATPSHSCAGNRLCLKGRASDGRPHAIGVGHTGEGGPARLMIFYRYPPSRSGPDHDCHQQSH